MTSHIVAYFARRAELIRAHLTPSKPPKAGSEEDELSQKLEPTSSLEYCTFCEIVASREPAYKIYEDDNVIAILDILPISRGHTLVVPKDHYARMTNLPSALGAAIGAVLPNIARAVTQAVGQPDFNIVNNNGHGQVVDHVHFHVVPAPKLSSNEGWRKLSEFRMRSELDDEDAVALVNAIKEYLPPKGP